MNTNSYFTIEILTSGSIRLYNNGTDAPNATFYYWINKEPNAARDNYDGSVTTTSNYWINNLNPGDKIKFYRAETTRLNNGEVDTGGRVSFGGDCDVNLSGNLASLIGFSETLPTYCFRYLFYNWNIIDASRLELPWDTLTQACFIRLFFSNTKLLYPPKLPATNLAANCYQYMFYGDSSLEKSPELMAKSLQSSCYSGMFGGCTSLNYIVCLAEGTSLSLGNFTQNVSATGTFIKHPDATWVSGNSGIPSGWTVKNMNQDTQVVDYQNIKSVYTKGRVPIKAIYAKGNILLWEYIYSDDYFTIQLLETGSFSWKMNGSGASYTIEYSKNGGEWTSITSDNNGVSISGVSGDRFRFKGLNDRYTKVDSTSYNTNYSFFDLTVRCNISGNIMSLINGNDFSGTSLTSSNTYAFYALFKPSDTTNGSKLISAENLILPEASCRNCFEQMFYGSKNMIKGPKVIYVTDTDPSDNNVYCCYYMFKDCVLLEEAPELPSDYIPALGYTDMFNGCTNLRYIKCLAIRSASSNITDWVNGVQTTSGLFIKATNSIINWSTGVNGIPANWTVVEAS